MPVAFHGRVPFGLGKAPLPRASLVARLGAARMAQNHKLVAPSVNQGDGIAPRRGAHLAWVHSIGVNSVLDVDQRNAELGGIDPSQHDTAFAKTAYAARANRTERIRCIVRSILGREASELLAVYGIDA